MISKFEDKKSSYSPSPEEEEKYKEVRRQAQIELLSTLRDEVLEIKEHCRVSPDFCQKINDCNYAKRDAFNEVLNLLNKP